MLRFVFRRKVAIAGRTGAGWQHKPGIVRLMRLDGGGVV
jgi:hypothetical protein